MEDAATAKNRVLIELKGIRKEYVTGRKVFVALNGVDLKLPRKGLVTILGPSGSGKTTLLNIIGGLDRFQGGDLIIDGESTKDFKDRDWDNYRNRHVGFVFQNYNLVSTYTIEKNLTIPLAMRGDKRAYRRKKAIEALKRVGLDEDLKKKPGELSGGQQQRVAIARALVSDPSLLLCDEPTGALDSKSSLACMNLLKDLSKDRLVLVITHNQQLADKFSDRTIVIEDGRIVADSDPLEEETRIVPVEKKEKVKMGFASAVMTGGKNILLKKGRNIITSLACSVGIVGVCLVLGLSTGFQSYVDTVEKSVGSSVPISITPSTYRSRSNNTDRYGSENEFPDDNLLRVYDTSSSSYLVHTNNFTPEYLSYLRRITDDPSCPAYGSAMSILENRKGMDFHFLTQNGDKEEIVIIDDSQSAGTLGSLLNSYANIPGTIIHEIYGDENLLDSYYSVIAGKLPEKADELVLVVDRFNRVDFRTLRRLGFFSETSYEMLNEEKRTIDFDDILYSGEGDSKFKEYKCYRNSDFYDLENPAVFKDKAYEDVEIGGEGFNPNDPSTYENIEVNGKEVEKELLVYPGPSSLKDFYNEDHNAISLKIVGVIRPTTKTYLSLMPTSLAYRSELKEIMVNDYETKSKILAEAQQNNWFLPVRVSEQDGKTIVDSSDGLAKIKENILALSKAFSEASSNPESAISTNSLALFDGAIRYLRATAASVDEQGKVTSAYVSTSASSFFSWNRSVGGDIKPIEVGSIGDLFSYYVNGNFFSSEAKENILNVLAYINAYSLITSISIFPTSLTSKAPLKEYLDAWNEGKSDADSIVYDDIVSDITDSIGEVISMLSLVLVVFASISLVVSSVMTSIVSYVSVVERKKEIGVLRSCGARKRDVGLLFETESAMLGLVSGIIGIFAAFIISIPVNIYVSGIYPDAYLTAVITITPIHILILIGLAVILALISGFVPSRMAARKDPVECLRND